MACDYRSAVLPFTGECLTCITALAHRELKLRYCILALYLLLAEGSWLLFFGISNLIQLAYARGGSKTESLDSTEKNTEADCTSQRENLLEREQLSYLLSAATRATAWGYCFNKIPPTSGQILTIKERRSVLPSR